MKRTIYVIMAFLFAAGVQAQVVDQKGLDAFIDELKKLGNYGDLGYNVCNYVCIWERYDHVQNSVEKWKKPLKMG